MVTLTYFLFLLRKDSGEADVLVKEKVNGDEANILVDGKVKYEVSPTSYTAKLSYRDVLVKGNVNKNAANTSKKGIPDTKNFFSISYDQREEGLKLYFKGVDAISTLMDERMKEDFPIMILITMMICL
jgi:hypothetical protein